MKFDKHEINNYGNNDIGIGKSGNGNNKSINININDDDGKNTKFFFPWYCDSSLGFCLSPPLSQCILRLLGSSFLVFLFLSSFDRLFGLPFA